ncbi:MAG TPA: ABC transporter ATP-binding protein [Candidatus Methylomirabilis sp.]|nr:ABC transporter ATP-binding protein [Candidatus Methylomirabilis sp.]HSC72045.1 ABC transporter ATP-binding protein [Candidatus Methylomirabilis sp.]
MFEIRDVHVAYGSVTALRGISLDVREGEIVCLLGANGAGKSTTLRTVSGLLHPLRGEVLLRGRPIHRLSAEAIVRLGISHVPEGRRIFPGLTVRENLVLGASNRRVVRRQELEDDMAQMFRIFPDLERLKHALGWTLSGGQQQMLAIARGLMARPQVLLMDEPSLGLAPILVQEVFRVIKEINATRGTTLLLVEQNASMALSVSHRGYVMETGRIVLQGSAQDLLRNPQVKDAYLGGRKTG